ncbi:hypothetical protein [Halorubrum persicum]|nr:hypothetical protein [Halorubrum persicum]
MSESNIKTVLDDLNSFARPLEVAVRLTEERTEIVDGVFGGDCCII